jgi:phage-related protein (TIGR01555 family)
MTIKDAAIRVFRDRVARRVDGWTNALSGLGILGRDRTASTIFEPDAWLDDMTIAAMYHHDDTSAKIVDLKPAEAFRQGVTLIGDPKSTEVVRARMDRIELLPRLEEGFAWGRAYGGALLVLGANDGHPMSAPLDWNRVRSFDFVRVYDKRDVQIDYWRDVYRVTDLDRGAFYDVHESRCFRFPGARTGDRERRERAGWDASVLQRCHDKIRDFNEAYHAASVLVGESSVGVFKMHGLIAAIAGENAKDIATRASLVDLTKSVARSIFLDADEGEDYRREAVQFSGLSDVLDRMANRLASASGIPVTFLMGQAPAGLNATGDADVRIFYDTVRAFQTTEVKPKIEQIVHVLARLEGVNAPTVDFPSLWQESPTEEATRRKTIAETDRLYFDIGAATEEQIARSRWRAEGFSADMLPPTPASRSLLGPEQPATTVEKREIPVTPTDIATVVTVNEVRASMDLPLLPGPEGAKTLPQFQAANASTIAAAAAAVGGATGPEKPAPATAPTPPVVTSPPKSPPDAPPST